MLILTALLSSLYKNKEAYQNVDYSNNDYIIAYVILVIYISLIVIYSYGAAKLSFSYSTYTGSTWGSSLFYSIVAFVFSEFYYPFYSYALNPLYDIKRKNS